VYDVAFRLSPFAFRLSPFAFRLSPFAPCEGGQRMSDDHADASSDGGPKRSGKSLKLGSLSDEQLAAACLLQDEHSDPAFTELARRSSDAVRRAVDRARAKSPRPTACDRDDLVQTFFAKLAENNATILRKFLREKGELSHYLARVAYCRSLKELNKHRVNWPRRWHNAERAELERVAARRPATELQCAGEVDRALSSLSSTTLGIVQAKYGLEPFTSSLPVQEIARMNHLSERSVYRKLAAALGKLGKRLRMLFDLFNDEY